MGGLGQVWAENWVRQDQSVRRGLLGISATSGIKETRCAWGRSVERLVSDSAPRPLSSLENPKFPGILARLEESPVCQRLPLTSFLILPFQRVTRLKMLVEVARFRKGREGEAGLTLWSITF